MNAGLRKLIPWGLAACYLLFVMRGADQGPCSPDAGQHATNGALIYDYLCSGAQDSPITFAKNYLAHYPAISVGYHPPVFHVIEALYYAVFGVSPFAARLSVAVFAALSIVLLYRLVRHTHGSDWFAALVCVVFASLQTSQQAASDVMLEFPSLFFALLALNCLLDFANGFTWRAAILYALISSVAIWTKQHCVFLGLIPFFLVFTTGRWSELRRWPLWGGAMLFGASCLLLAAFMTSILGDDLQPASQIAILDSAEFVFVRNLKYYALRLDYFFGWPAMLLTLSACLAYLTLLIRDRSSVQRLAVYGAWAVSVLPVPAVAQQYDDRYLFAGFPALLVILFDMVGRLAQRFVSEPQARWVTVVIALMVFGVRTRDHVTHISGPVEAAQFVWEQQPKRVLVCGRGEYQFIFAIRCRAGNTPSLIILRGSKLPPEVLKTETFDRFAHDYGIEFVVLGDDWKAYSRSVSADPLVYPWDPILSHPSPEMKLERKLEMTNTFGFMEGDVLVYRFLNPSPNPKSGLSLWMGLMRESLDVDLDRANEPSGEDP